MGIFGALMAKIDSAIPDEQRGGAEKAVAGIAEGAAGMAVVAAVDKPITADIAALAKEAVHPSIPPATNVESTSYSSAGVKAKSDTPQLG